MLCAKFHNYKKDVVCMTWEKEINRRKTFAIISHPDAGKTTLTEKFLLYGGAVQLAGSVTARKNQRASTSDWMELERKRGISISSTILQFEYNGYRINLLDTPGHQDFSEDTYRVLTAVDAVVMVIDAAKGIESQTRKLFEVCRRRQVPIFTFMNKLDRPAKDPLALIDELESVLKIGAFPMNWPLGAGTEFKGVFDRRERQMHLFERTMGGSYRAPVSVFDLNNPHMHDRIEAQTLRHVIGDLEMLDHAGEKFDEQTILNGSLTPVFFGSAANNFGVQLLLDGFLELSGRPRPRPATIGPIAPEHEAFSGFIFKIQANMDPRHRDRIAFLRVCSGRFTRDMIVTHVRTGKSVRLSNSHKLFGQQRETVDEAYPGDIVGLVGHGEFGIGDTLTDDLSIEYHEIPRFPPEHLAFLHNPTPAKFKRFREGLDQLMQEGVVQSLYQKNSGQRVPILAAVGPLQFEVVQYRMQSEYGAETRLERTNWKVLRWVDPEIESEEVSRLILPTGSAFVEDISGQTAILFTDEWALNYFAEKHPAIRLAELAFREEAETVWDESVI